MVKLKAIRLIQSLLLIGSLAFAGGGILVVTTDFLSAQTPEAGESEEEETEAHDRGPRFSLEDLRASPYPRPDETSARTLEQGRDILIENESLERVIEAVESHSVTSLIELAKKGDYCSQSVRGGLPECKEGGSVVGVYQQLVFRKPVLRSVSDMQAWLHAFFEGGGPTHLDWASRDSRLPEGDGGEYVLVFRSEKPTSVSGGGRAYDGLGLIIAPSSSQAPILSFAFLSARGNSLRWLQQLGLAEFHSLILPETTDGIPGWFEDY